MPNSRASQPNHTNDISDERARIDSLQIQYTQVMIETVLAVFRSQRVEDTVLGLDAEDIVSELFARYRETGLPTTAENPRSYLCTAARHDAIDQLRRKRYDIRLPDADTTAFISCWLPGVLTMPRRTTRANDVPLRLDDEVPTRRKES